VRSRTPEEPEIKGHEHQDNSDVYCQPFPELVPEEQDVHADHDGHQREDVKRGYCMSSHRFFLLCATERSKSGADSLKRCRDSYAVRVLDALGGSAAKRADMEVAGRRQPNKTPSLAEAQAAIVMTDLGEEQLSVPVDELRSLDLLGFDAVPGEPGNQVLTTSPDEAASGEPGVIGDLSDRRRRREEQLCFLV
jgi:hypothetical protein